MHFPQHTGFITPEQFRSCLGRFKLQRLFLNDRHLSALGERYTTTDSQGFPKIAYTHFVDDIDETFAMRRMEKDPTLTLKHANAYANAPTTRTLPADEEVRAECIMAKIKYVFTLTTFQASRNDYPTEMVTPQN